MSDNLEKKEYVISKIKQIVKDEKFKVDAFFFCGFPGGTPNEKLKNACEKYLEIVENGKSDDAVTQQLITELEAATQLLSAEKAGTLVNNVSDVQEVLNNRQYL